MLYDELKKLDEEYRRKLRKVGLAGRFICDCGEWVYFYWSWYYGYEWLICNGGCKIEFKDYYFLE